VPFGGGFGRHQSFLLPGPFIFPSRSPQMRLSGTGFGAPSRLARRAALSAGDVLSQKAVLGRRAGWQIPKQTPSRSRQGRSGAGRCLETRGRRKGGAGQSRAQGRWILCASHRRVAFAETPSILLYLNSMNRCWSKTANTAKYIGGAHASLYFYHPELYSLASSKRPRRPESPPTRNG